MDRVSISTLYQWLVMQKCPLLGISEKEISAVALKADAHREGGAPSALTYTKFLQLVLPRDPTYGAIRIQALSVGSPGSSKLEVAKIQDQPMPLDVATELRRLLEEEVQLLRRLQQPAHALWTALGDEKVFQLLCGARSNKITLESVHTLAVESISVL